jgi:hypothetical protein
VNLYEAGGVFAICWRVICQVSHSGSDAKRSDAFDHNVYDLVPVEEGLLGSLELVFDGSSNVVDVLIVAQLTAYECHIHTAEQAGAAIGEHVLAALFNVQKPKVICLVRGEGVQAALAAPPAPYLGATGRATAIEHLCFIMLAKWA